MTAAEEIAAAIEKLEALQSAAFPGEWTAYHSGVANGDHSHVVANDASIAYISANDGIDEEFRAPTADLIVALHRTIDAQLALLRESLRSPAMTGHGIATLGLARAILGEAS